MKALLAASALLLTGPGTPYFSGLPPARFRSGETTVTLRIVAPERIHAACGARKRTGLTLRGCARRNWFGGATIVLPDPCPDGTRDRTARILCHELAHARGGWACHHPL